MSRRVIPKAVRLAVYDKCNHRCAYCGCELDYKDMQVDHARNYLSRIHKRLMRDSIPYQVAERFGIVEHKSDDVTFCFEKLDKQKFEDAYMLLAKKVRGKENGN